MDGLAAEQFVALRPGPHVASSEFNLSLAAPASELVRSICGARPMATTGGYVYVPNADPGVMAGVAVGDVVRKPDQAPPWIVVHHALKSVLVARWPGRLWRVVVLDTNGVEQASADAPYTRAIAVRVLEEMSPARLFGHDGDAVVAVISAASGMDLLTARRLADARHPQADAANSRVWHRWLESIDRGSEFAGQDLGQTLEMGSGGGARSPVGCGTTVLHRTVWERADTLQASEAFVEDEEGERCLGPMWALAHAALADAQLALGYTANLPEGDRLILTAAWRAAFETNTPRSNAEP